MACEKCSDHTCKKHAKILCKNCYEEETNLNSIFIIYSLFERYLLFSNFFFFKLNIKEAINFIRKN